MSSRSFYWILVVAFLSTFVVLSSTFDLQMKSRCGAVGEDRPLVEDLKNPGQMVPPEGDYYNRTKCYCRRLEGTPDTTIWDGSYVHISYFSKSQARRFDMEWTCKANSVDRNTEWGDTDCAAKQNMEDFYRPGEFRYIGCVDCGDANTLKWCYGAQHQAQNPDESILWIRNDPRRTFIPSVGRPVFNHWREIIDYCDHICKEKVDPLTGCMYWSENYAHPVAENALDYIDNAWVLKSRWHHHDERSEGDDQGRS